MPIDFPSSPALNATYSSGGRTWKWNGTGWAVEPVTLTSGAVVAALGYSPLPAVTISGGAPTTSPADGAIHLDNVNHRVYVRSGGTWKYAQLGALTWQAGT